MTPNVMYYWYDAKMRASRLLSILMLLQTRGRMSAPSLAAELEVSERTILRDIDQLSAAGVPVWSDRGRDGGFQLREGWSTELTGLTEAEAQALFLAGLPGAATELGLGSASASARLKMLAAVPIALREDALRVSARLHIDPVDWYRAATPPTYLQAVADAVWHQRILSIRYESWTGVKSRVVKPLGLVLKAGVWYMAALTESQKQKSRQTSAQTTKEPRIYRLSNIQGLSVREGTFKHPKKFDLATFWQEATRRFEADIYRDVAALRVNARGMKLLKEMSAAISDGAAKSAMADSREGGWSKVVVPIESLEHAAHQFMGLGADAEVLEPAALRKRVSALVSAMGAMYAN
jgi:predicted DNA-binding transcriptional regulator YafY